MSKRNWIISIGALLLSVIIVLGAVLINSNREESKETNNEYTATKIEGKEETEKITVKEKQTEVATETESLIEPGIVIPILDVPEEVRVFCGDDYDALEGHLLEVMLAFYYGEPKRAVYDSHTIENEKITVCFKLIMDSNEYTDIIYYRDLRKVTHKLFS